MPTRDPASTTHPAAVVFAVALAAGTLAPACRSPATPATSATAPAAAATAAPAATTPRPEAPPPHPDFERLRPFHNYYRVLSVGDYRHHFVAMYHHVELVTAYYDVGPEPGAPVRRRGESFGLFVERRDSEPVPARAAAMASAVRADLETHHQAGRDLQLFYVGAYRPVEVEEIVVRAALPRDPERINRRMVLMADRDLTRIDGPARFEVSTGGTLRLTDAAEHPDRPGWIDAGLGRQGVPRLWEVYRPDNPFDAERRTGFEAAALASARRLLDGHDGLALADLAGEQDPRVLPDDLEDRRPFIFYVDGVERGRRQTSARVWLAPGRAFGGAERAQLSLAIDTRRGDARFEASLELRGPPVPDGASGEIELPVTVAYRIRASGAAPTKVVGGAVEARARLMVDGERRHVIELSTPIPQHDFDGVEPYTRFEAHLGIMGLD